MPWVKLKTVVGGDDHRNRKIVKLDEVVITYNSCVSEDADRDIQGFISRSGDDQLTLAGCSSLHWYIRSTVTFCNSRFRHYY